MKILIVGNFHHKNKEGLEAILNKLNYQFNYGNVNDIENYHAWSSYMLQCFPFNFC